MRILLFISDLDHVPEWEYVYKKVVSDQPGNLFFYFSEKKESDRERLDNARPVSLAYPNGSSFFCLVSVSGAVGS